MWDLSSPTKYQTCTPFIGSTESYNHWITREVPTGYFHLHSLRLFSQPYCDVGIIILPCVEWGDWGLQRLSHSQVIDIAVNWSKSPCSFFFLAVPHDLWDVSPPIRDWISTFCNESAKSEPLEESRFLTAPLQPPQSDPPHCQSWCQPDPICWNSLV